MRKLVLIIIAFLALFTFIRTFTPSEQPLADSRGVSDFAEIN
jgi:hypothetical protein